MLPIVSFVFVHVVILILYVPKKLRIDSSRQRIKKRAKLRSAMMAAQWSPDGDRGFKESTAAAAAIKSVAELQKKQMF